MTEPQHETRTHFCYYNTDCGSGRSWLREVGGLPPTAEANEYYSSCDIEVDHIAISVATADEEDGEPPGHFTFEIRAKDVAAALNDRKFDVDLKVLFSKAELTRLHAVFGLFLGISE